MPPETHHPLHLLGHLVTAQVVVEGALGPPVGRVVSDGIGPLAVHLGNHGFLFFLKSNRDASVCVCGGGGGAELQEEPRCTDPRSLSRNKNLARQNEKQPPLHSPGTRSPQSRGRLL